MLSEMNMRPMMGGNGGDGFSSEEMSLLLREQRMQEASDWERELNTYRSGSAPPTVEGSLSAIGGLFSGNGNGGLLNAPGAKQVNGFASEEELRSDPAYLEYYYSHVNLNPRLPPPLLSKEDWRFTQKLQAGNSTYDGIGDRRTKPNQLEGEGSRSLFSTPLVFGSEMEELGVEPWRAAGSSEWLEKRGDGLIGLPGIELGLQKNFDTMFQDDLRHATPALGHLSRPASRNAYNGDGVTLSSVEAHLDLQDKIRPADALWCGTNLQSIPSVQTNGFPAAHTFASVLASARSNSNGADRKPNNSSDSFNGGSSNMSDPDDLAAVLSGISLSGVGAADKDIANHSSLQQETEGRANFTIDLEGSQNLIGRNKKAFRDVVSDNGVMKDLKITDSKHDGLLEVSNFSSSSSPGSSFLPNISDMNATFSSYGLGGLPIDPTLSSMLANHNNGTLSPLLDNASVASGTAFPDTGSRVKEGYFPGLNLNGTNNLHNRKRTGSNTAASALQVPADPLYIQYLRAAEYAAQAGIGFNDLERFYMGNSYTNLIEIQKAYLGPLLQSEKNYGMPFINKSANVDNGYYGNSGFGFGYPGSPLTSPVAPASLGRLGSPLRTNISEYNMQFPSTMRNLNGSMMGAWRADTNCMVNNNYSSSLLDEFKNNKAKCYELCEIAGHVVEFSADQYGSRFIQQKLETATKEEKDMVFEEIMPQALTLMTDVFGNYVVQKFFEHGSAAQIRELADQLTGHVLALSLQMYGCRVIQKAIEVVDLDQKTKMVSELDGHVMRCVRDQNGNHVIQKCIERIPEDAIEFIVSTFYGQVVTLSAHPYGCRVIQRVLEHCHDPKTQEIMMDEILQSVCMLAQDQYGNYVVQHVLEHGKPHERSAIINKLTGQIVQMSQQKFASNVIEKCLTFGDPDERQSLIKEMLGSAEQSEPLEVMMKDQFANYVVQKVLETCDDEQREIILTRIKVHLSALKKYTYGKHIVARVEKLVAAGERRAGIQSACSS